MSKLSYWEKRKAELMIGQMDKAEKQAEQMAKVYELAMRHLQGQADKVFDKFQRDYGLTETQAKEVLNRAHKLDNINDLKRVLEASPNDPNVQQLLADLDSPAYAHRIEQFHRLQEQTKATVEKLAGAEIASSQGFYRRIAEDSFHRSTFALQQQTGLGYQFNSPSEAEIEALLRSNWEGNNFSKRIWNNTQSLAQSLKNEMLVGLMTGKSNKAMVEVIERKFGTGKANARRLVRTETAFFHGQMELKSYEEADVEWYRFVAVLDLRTSEKCQHKDGETYKVSEAVEGINYPPLHPYCRSTTIASDDKEWLSKLERRARDPETGKTVTVPADMTYKEWRAKFVKKASETVEKAAEKVYNQGMNNLDLMGKHRRFNAVGKDSQTITAKTRKNEGTAFDIWSENDTKNSRDTVDLLQSALEHYHHEDMPTFVILSNKKLSWGKRQGLAAYDYTQNVMFLSSDLISEENVRDILSDGHFAARNFDELLEHELTHKTHWDNVKRLYKHNPKRYNNVEEAKRSIDSKLLDYVAQQRKTDRLYVKNVVSPNAHFALLDGNVNELVADVNVLSKTDRLTDTILLKLVKEVLGK